MGNAMIGFLLGAGFGTWVYTKIMRTSGNNTKQAVTVAAIAGGAAFLLAFTLLSLVPAN